jgi:hypothetical protein
VSRANLGAGPLGLIRRRPDACALVAVFLLALAIRLGFGLRVFPFVSKDSQSYFLPAWDLVHAGEFELGLRRTPGYSGFIAAILLLFGDDLRAVTLVQHLLGAATAALTYALGRLTFGRLAGLGAGVLVACSAPLLAYEHYVLTESLFAFILTAACAALVCAWRSPRPARRLWLLGGVLVGLAALVRPVGQGVLPLAILAALAGSAAHEPADRRRLGYGLVSAALVLAGYTLLVLPWTVRNQLAHSLSTPSTFGRTLIARTASYDRGFVFYDPDLPPSGLDARGVRARQIVQQGADDRESDGTIAQHLRQALDLDPIEVNALMREIAIEAILRQPLHFVEGTVAFAVRIFHGEEIRLREHLNERRDVVWEERTRHLLEPGPWSEDDFRAASRQLGWYQPARFAPLPLILFAIGLVAAAALPHWRPALLPGLTAVALILASAALDGPQERYRYPADPAIQVLMAGGLVVMAAALRRALGRVRGAAPSLAQQHSGQAS